jgi:hypothetical protein
MGIGAAGVAAIGAVASAGAGIAGGIMQSNTAAKGQAAARAQFEQQRNDLGPYREAGLGSIQAQQDLLGLNGQPAADAAMTNYQHSPGYAWQFDEGQRAVESSQAAQGMLRSGATMKALEKFGSGLANTDFGQYYTRLNQLSTLGQSSAAGAPVAAAAGVETGGANAQSSIYGNTASALGGTANTLLNSTAVQNWLGGGGAVDTAIGRANGLAPAYTPSSTYSAPIGVAPGLGAIY